MLNPRDFQKRFKQLLLTPVAGMTWEDKLARIRAYMRELEARKNPEEESADASPSIEIVPFEAGRRPIDEALQPSHGASEHAGVVSTTPGDAPMDDIWLLYQLKDCYTCMPPFNRPLEVRLSAAFLPHEGEEAPPVPIPGLTDVRVTPHTVSGAAFPIPALESASWEEFHGCVYAFTLAPEKLLPARDDLPSGGYAWSDLDDSLRARTPDGDDPFTLAHLFHQKVRLTLSLRVDEELAGSDSLDVEIYDIGRSGSLYARLLDRLVAADTVTQAQKLGITDLHPGYHPWFPVLTIGMDKARLYLRAIRQDLAEQRRNLPDPNWLMRVGLYLELLTCIGIFEAVKDEHPDLLSPGERLAFEGSPAYAAVRSRLAVEEWRRVWAMREISPRSSELFSTGPVAFTNLLRKQRATLAFLHAHHEDLKQAIELAGPNLDNAQETWHRVFRDAERAVLHNSLAAFPELGWLDFRTREFVLWHQRGQFGGYSIPGPLTGIFGDQDGLFPSACRQYRRSMNDVAFWARTRGLMDYTGEECIPIMASLLEANMMHDRARLGALQRRDGYGSQLDVAAPLSLPTDSAHESKDAASVLRRVPVLRPLTDREIGRLASKARRIIYGPLDRIVIQGEKGSSLFVLESGACEVLVRQPDGRDVLVATLEPGAIFGEVALLTGGERTATVRSLGEATLYEIGRQALAPIIDSRPQLAVELGLLVAERSLEVRERLSQSEVVEESGGIATRIRRFLLGA